MCSLTIVPRLVPCSKPKSRTLFLQDNRAFGSCNARPKKMNLSSITITTTTPVARLFGPATFDASKLHVMYLGVDRKKHPAKLLRTYTLTHSDITSELTLAISHSINNSQLQGWYNRLRRDEVVAEWKKVKGNMSLHVHCHISGGHVLLHLFARLRYVIFCREIPVVLKAIMHGDGDLFNKHCALQEALVWVHFHSNLPEFNKIECWGQLKDAQAPSPSPQNEKCREKPTKNVQCKLPQPCKGLCHCCFPKNQMTSATELWCKS